MYVQTGKTFIATLIAVVLALGGLAVLSSDAHKDAPSALARTEQSASAPAQTTPSAYEQQDSAANDTANSNPSGFEEGYKAGYRDGHQDCTANPTASSGSRAYYSRRAYYPRRSGVAGTRYYAETRRGHSTRNMILTIAGPAAVGAGIGAIAHGGKGAGIGALLGGGGGALYYLVKHRRN
jgi:hypothetical protein